jgi:hypothetical protein
MEESTKKGKTSRLAHNRMSVAGIVMAGTVALVVLFFTDSEFRVRTNQSLCRDPDLSGCESAGVSLREVKARRREYWSIRRWLRMVADKNRFWVYAF